MKRYQSAETDNKNSEGSAHKHKMRSSSLVTYVSRVVTFSGMHYAKPLKCNAIFPAELAPKNHKCPPVAPR